MCFQQWKRLDPVLHCIPKVCCYTEVSLAFLTEVGNPDTRCLFVVKTLAHLDRQFQCGHVKLFLRLFSLSVLCRFQ